MANWCINTLHVIGFEDEGEIETFLEAVEEDGRPLSFSRVVPLPCDGYDHDVAVQTWGTKWQPDHVDMTDHYSDRVRRRLPTSPPVRRLAHRTAGV